MMFDTVAIQRARKNLYGALDVLDAAKKQVALAASELSALIDALAEDDERSKRTAPFADAGITIIDTGMHWVRHAHDLD